MRAAPTDPAATSGPAPRLRRPWWTKLSRAQVAAVVTALVAGGLNAAALQRGDARTAVLVAAADLAAGSVLDETSVAHAAVGADAAFLDALIPAERLAQRTGWLLTRPLKAGEPLRWSDVRDAAAGAGLRAMSLPVEPEHAAGGGLRPGDRVDVIAVREGRAFWVLSDVEVLAVTGADDTGGLGAPRAPALTLAVDEQQAIRLAWAMHDGAIEVVRATGARPLGNPQSVLSGMDSAPAADGGAP